ncbi:MAG: high-affinity branched-chain amino acid ABC transporter permease LivM [Proteobacteria bacterium]|nr:high-affinity branched-chain amino acid ABC transporter permease LivM [Pseudomonadota bacterium]MBU1388465.1 high-affinity branched-chain amino acid ABC transporter permease LivM [Pseudomonadota bacterium]MBU1542711.1 high-affinity branched-chain amino acid ABC transporter permease LivM [Pseudomonadota bacterium]MBU2481245.1 high-affinity branched-chain amino acid ABC transporter permease LivM [Pseudomonadota bacterium]
MPVLNEIKKSLIAAIWFMFLTFPIMVIKVNTITRTIDWRWKNMMYTGIGAFFLSAVWRYMLRRKEKNQNALEKEGLSIVQKILQVKTFSIPATVLLLIFAIVFPHLFSMHQTNIMISALIYVMLGLGLNIVVGLAGLLDLGYVAFFAVGAYAYALLNLHFGLGFWTVLPVGGFLGAVFGILLGYPVLRLRGDYLAIVTLGFGEIIRIILENWNEFSFGPAGIANIPKPELFGLDLSLSAKTIYLYYIIVLLVIFTVFVINRLTDSRIGRAWIALKDDEIACQAMGIDKAKTKLRAFALGATWAGMGGVVFAAKTAFINPASFTIWESVIILCTVVAGGMGSIVGVICGALLLILLPEYLRDFGQFRMITFGAVLVLMMVFRPGGMIENVRRTYQFKTGETNDIHS